MPCKRTLVDRRTEGEAVRAWRFGTEKTLTRLTVGEPLGLVKSGDRMRVRVRNAIGADATSDEELDRFMRSGDYKCFGHQYTGPIQVEGIPRDASLAIHVRSIDVFSSMSCLSTSTGFLRGAFEGRQPVVSAPTHGVASLPGLTLRGAPSIGAIATLDEVVRRPGRCSDIGGNLDFPQLAAGATIHLPIAHTPVQFAVGDLHFRQGCGESSGMGLEADGELELEVWGTEPHGYPVIEAPSLIAIVGWGETLDAAMKLAVNNALEYLCRLSPFSAWSKARVYQLLGGFDLVLGNATGSIVTCAQTFTREALLDPATGNSVVLPPRPLGWNAPASLASSAAASLASPAAAPLASPAAAPLTSSAAAPLASPAEPLLSAHRGGEAVWADVLSAAVESFDELPVYHAGDSREIRAIPEREDLLVAKLSSNVYSWSARGVVHVPGTAAVRARMNARLCQVLHDEGIRTSTLATLDEYVLMSRQPVASRIEVVIKTSFRGSPKHRYRQLTDVPQRRGAFFAAGARHAPYVRFDWRNPRGEEDEVLPEGLADHFIDVATARATVLRAHQVLNEFLAPRDLEVVDGCFFSTDDGRVLCGEVSADNLTFRYLGGAPELEQVIEGRAKPLMLERWAAIDQLIRRGPRSGFVAARLTYGATRAPSTRG